MADNVLAARFQLRYDMYSNWMMSSTILLPGEIPIAVINRTSIAGTDITPENTPPSIGIKVGDGYHHFDELPWLQAIAADVYNWAKSINKPTYSATEITGLAEYIAAHSSGGSGGGDSGIIGANSAYQITYNSVAQKYILQYYDEEEGIWKDSAGDEINLNGLLTRVSTIERWANGASNNLGAIELPLTAFIYDEVVTYLNRLDVNDVAVPHQFVTAVSQSDGRIDVSRSILTASDIASGVFNTEQGGTGLTQVEEDEVLVGSLNGTITTKTFVTTIEPTDRNSFATVGAIIDYVSTMTAGLTGAMHFIGEATVAIDVNVNNHANPQINGYDFHKAQPGDVVLANNAQELVWTGTEWRLLGDEGSYAIKGSITNIDIAAEANIDQEKINGLVEALNNKVTKVEGKSLSTNDYTTEEKNKLAGIEYSAQENVIEHIFVNDIETQPGTFEGQTKSVNLRIPILSAEDVEKLASIESGAQVNPIEHIYVNGAEVNPATINDVTKVVNIEFIPFTLEEQTKLSEIESEAQVNKIETLTINGTEYVPDVNKNIDITIDQAALNLNVIAGARVPGVVQNTYEDVEVTQGIKKLELARIAKTGLVNDLKQTNDSYITLYCGTSTEVI